MKTVYGPNGEWLNIDDNGNVRSTTGDNGKVNGDQIHMDDGRIFHGASQSNPNLWQIGSSGSPTSGTSSSDHDWSGLGVVLAGALILGGGKAYHFLKDEFNYLTNPAAAVRLHLSPIKNSSDHSSEAPTFLIREKNITQNFKDRSDFDKKIIAPLSKETGLTSEKIKNALLISSNNAMKEKGEELDGQELPSYKMIFRISLVTQLHLNGADTQQVEIITDRMNKELLAPIELALGG